MKSKLTLVLEGLFIKALELDIDKVSITMEFEMTETVAMSHIGLMAEQINKLGDVLSNLNK